MSRPAKIVPGPEPGKRLVALVTGASSGIGEATARLLHTEYDAELILVARRRSELEALAEEFGGATVIVADVTKKTVPARIAAEVEREHGRLDLLVNNAGAAFRGDFAETGYEGVRKNMDLNFDAVLRVTEALLPLLRRSAPSAVVNVTSVAGRTTRAGSGGYSASKFALVGWTDALRLEERVNGIHVTQVLPGFIATEGFRHEKIRSKPWTSWTVSTSEKVAEAILDAAFNNKPERYVPRAYWLGAALRLGAPRLVLGLLGRSGRW